MFKTKFFANATKKGETFELKAELNADTKDKRKDAVKKVIANMTIGKDVSMLFADVVKNMQTEDLELKKLVYLYLINYAKTQPELVILAINTFVKDVDDNNPLIRALAIRTMACLNAQKIVDYICEPLRKTLKDSHPYVRKTAALAVVKLFELNPILCVENGFLNSLQDLLSDSNPMVVANAVASLLELKETSSRKDIFIMNATLVNSLLVALNECTEWGQIGILESLVTYKPLDSSDAEKVIERITARLQHQNASVVLSAVKVIMVYLDYVSNSEFVKTTLKKLSPPLVSLLSSPPEVQYVALRNINLILQKKPDLLSGEIRVFFCKYNDPQYVKLQKLEIIIKLANDKNVDSVLTEFKE
jgi:AP-1 complex subunit beta-1